MRHNVVLSACLSVAVIVFGAAVCGAAELRLAQGATGLGGYSGAAAVDDATLQKVAFAAVKVMQIKTQASQTLQSTTDASAKQQIMNKAQSDEMAAVRNQGLSIGQYNQVIEAVQKDARLNTKFQSYVAAAQHPGP
jgi:hypothetical protein